MAAVPVEIRGTLYDLATKSSREVFIQGEAVRSDVGVGGGPLPPGGGEGIWGPTDPRPTPPIYLPGGGGTPPGFWGGGPHPQPPIHYPEGPPGGGQPPTDVAPGADKKPPATGGWGYVATWDDGSAGGWGFFPPGGGDKPQPPGGGTPPPDPNAPTVNPLTRR